MHFVQKSLKAVALQLNQVSLFSVSPIVQDKYLSINILLSTRREKSCFPSMKAATISEHDTFTPMAHEFTVSILAQQFSWKQITTLFLYAHELYEGNGRSAYFNFMATRTPGFQAVNESISLTP